MQNTSRFKGIPIGIDDFKMLIDRGGYYIDKSLFIKEILDDISPVKLITRPRRFGKTLNLSMLKYFFENAKDDHGVLFQNLQIQKAGAAYLAEQGRYPVVNLTFKDIKCHNFEDCLELLKIKIADEFKRHDYILLSDRIRESDKRQFTAVIEEKTSPVRLRTSLEFLTKILKEYYDRDVVVLIDEYDTPINQGYLAGYYEEIIDFMRNFLGGGLKGNNVLKAAVITGIYRVAKESIFSGFNNLEVSSVTGNQFADKFGFTENEVVVMLSDYDLEANMDEVKNWYNGYLFGDNTVIYNPWSIVNYVKNRKFEPYWVNTSSNDIIRQILLKTNGEVKQKLQLLLEGKELTEITLNSDTSFREISNREMVDEDVLWNLLLVSGYLKSHIRQQGGRTKGALKIPNREILIMFEDIILEWFKEGEVSPSRIKTLLAYLVDGEIANFKTEFEYLVQKTFSYFDVGQNTAENFYHAFILGLLVNLDGKYRIKSNVESGKGRPDVMLIPLDNTKKGVIMEFKVAGSEADEALQVKAQEALEQIEKMEYARELAHEGIKEAVEMGIVFYRKKTWIEFRTRQLR